MLIFYEKIQEGLTRSRVVDILAVALVCVLGTLSAAKTFEMRGVFADSPLSPAGDKYIVIIIDDYGYAGEGADDMLALGIPITAAVMPGLEFSESDAEKYSNAGFDVILHMPMEPHRGKSSWLGPYGLTSEISDKQVLENVMKGLETVKYAVGINNHMGSKIMEDERIMSCVMKIAGERNLIFIDSKTTQKSVAGQMAEKVGVRYYERDVFLDRIKSAENTKKQLLKAAEIAEKKGYAIAIGHVGTAGGKTTVDGIKQGLPGLIEKGFKFVTISDLDMRVNMGKLDIFD